MYFTSVIVCQLIMYRCRGLLNRFKILTSHLTYLYVRQMASATQGYVKSSTKRIVDITGKEIPDYPGIKDHRKSVYSRKQVWPWHDKSTFQQHIINNIVYNKYGVVGVNKPYGLFIGNKNCVDSTDYHKYTLYMAVSALCDELQMPELHLVKSIEYPWYQSGVVLFAKSEEIANVITQSMRQCLSQQKLPLHFWCVTLGCPRPLTHSEHTLAVWEDIEGLSLPVIVPERDGVTKTRRKLVSYTTLSHSVIGSGPERGEAALVELLTPLARGNEHLPLVYLASRAAPVLGDPYFSTRVKTVMGRQITIDPHMCRPAPQTPAAAVSRKLSLEDGDMQHLPLHLHLREVCVPVVTRSRRLLPSKLVSVTCPPPPHFTWTTTQLHIDTQDQLVE